MITQQESRTKTGGWKADRAALARFLATGCLLILAAAALSVAGAETITWVNPAGGSWTAAANWDPANVPDQSGEEALFPAGGGVLTTLLGTHIGLDAVRIDNPDLTLDATAGLNITLLQPAGLANRGTVILNGGNLFGAMFNELGGRVRIPSGRIELFYDDIDNDGVILVNSDQGAANSEFRVLTGTVTLGGSGELILQTAGDPIDAQVTNSYGDGILIHGPGHTIRGEGTIDIPVPDNQGRIIADVDGRLLLVSNNPITNNGILMGTNNGILQANSWAPITQGPTGLILADGGAVEFNGSSVAGGSLATANGGRMEAIWHMYLTGATNLGTFWIRGGVICTLEGAAITNDGVILVNSNQSASNTELRISDYGLVLGGTGEVVLQTSGTNPYYGAQISENYGSLVHASGHTIRGEGDIWCTTTNHGLILGNVPGRPLNMDGPIANYSICRADGGLLQSTYGTLTNNGIVEAIRGGTYRAAWLPANYSAGTLTGGTWRAYENSTLRFLNGNITTLDATLILDGPNSNVYSSDGSADALAGMTTIGPSGRFEVCNSRDYACALPLDNRGQVVVGPAGILSVPGLQTGEGGFGLTTVDGRLSCASILDLHREWLSGTGTVAAEVLNAGRVQPGSSIGNLTIEGDYEQAQDGWLYIEISGTGEGEHDHLSVTGEARLGGWLVPVGLEGYEAQDGDSFPVLSFASRIGEFDHVAGCPAPGICFEAVYTDTTVVIVAHAIDPAGAEETALPPAEIRFSARAVPGGAAVLSLDLPERSLVDVAVFDLSGRRVAVVRQGEEKAGSHLYTWTALAGTGSRLSNGIYLVRARLQTKGSSRVCTSRLVLVR